VAPIEKSPAATAGIISADVITKINGRSTQGMTINEAVKQIKGAAGTPGCTHDPARQSESDLCAD
jgi:carboxyl-terminal processing protease